MLPLWGPEGVRTPDSDRPIFLSIPLRYSCSIRQGAGQFLNAGQGPNRHLYCACQLPGEQRLQSGGHVLICECDIYRGVAFTISIHHLSDDQVDSFYFPLLPFDILDLEKLDNVSSCNLITEQMTVSKYISY